MSLASSIACSTSRTFITDHRAKVSSRITFIEWSTSAITVGSYQSPLPSTRLPPVEDPRAAARASST